jgi:DedD protein
VQDVEIRIPGQDEKPFAPKFAAAPVEKAPEKAAEKPAVVPRKSPCCALRRPTGRSAEADGAGDRSRKDAKPADKAR